MNDTTREDAYLWDRSGDADPEIERLEELLGRFRYDESTARPSTGSAGPRSTAPMFGVLAAAAAALLLWIAVPRDRGPGYRVEGLDFGMAYAGDRFEVGEGGARIDLGGIGDVDFEAGSIVEVKRVGETHELFMERGALHAFVYAEPRVFQVGTPAGLTIDLGCEYTLEVLADGSSKLSVQTGQVAFGYGGREVYVPAGASCVSIPGDGPSPPLFDDTDAAFRGVVEAVNGMGKYGDDDVEALLDIGGYEDALPLAAMMMDERLDEGLRGQIFDRLETAFERPPGVTRSAILSGNRTAQAAWLDEMKPYWGGWKSGTLKFGTKGGKMKGPATKGPATKSDPARTRR